jgi:D-glycero-D-manno-heptose 1,7-bisphosphate phosphatase
MTVSKPFVLLDRDGTLNVEKHYLSDPDQLELYPGTGAALRRLREMGYGLAVLTNQSGVGRGYFGLDAVERVHERLREMLAAEGTSVDGIYICPHGPAEECDCRKPLPGLARQAMAAFGFDPRQAIMIGDKAADIGVGQAIGATTILVRTGWGADAEKARDCAPDVIVDDLAAAVQWIEARK